MKDRITIEKPGRRVWRLYLATQDLWPAPARPSFWHEVFRG